MLVPGSPGRNGTDGTSEPGLPGPQGPPGLPVSTHLIFSIIAARLLNAPPGSSSDGF